MNKLLPAKNYVYYKSQLKYLKVEGKLLFEGKVTILDETKEYVIYDRELRPNQHLRRGTGPFPLLEPTLLDSQEKIINFKGDEPPIVDLYHTAYYLWNGFACECRVNPFREELDLILIARILPPHSKREDIVNRFIEACLRKRIEGLKNKIHITKEGPKGRKEHFSALAELYEELLKVTKTELPQDVKETIHQLGQHPNLWKLNLEKEEGELKAGFQFTIRNLTSNSNKLYQWLSMVVALNNRLGKQEKLDKQKLDTMLHSISIREPTALINTAKLKVEDLRWLYYYWVIMNNISEEEIPPFPVPQPSREEERNVLGALKINSLLY